MQGPGYVHSLTHVHDLQNSQEYVRALQRPYEHLFPQLFLSDCFFIAYCLPQLLSTSNGYEVNQLSLIVLNKHLRGKRGFSHWVSSKSGKVKTVLQVGVFQETTRQMK